MQLYMLKERNNQSAWIVSFVCGNRGLIGGRFAPGQFAEPAAALWAVGRSLGAAIRSPGRYERSSQECDLLRGSGQRSPGMERRPEEPPGRTAARTFGQSRVAELARWA